MNRRGFMFGSAAAAGSIALLSDDEIVEFYAPTRTYVDLGKNTRESVHRLYDEEYFVVTLNTGLMVRGRPMQLEPGVYRARVESVIHKSGQITETSRVVHKIV